MSKRIALVTGGTGGIGTSICQELFTQGFTVVAGYNSGGNHDKAKAWQDEQRAAGYEFDLAYGDVSDSESARQCIEGIMENHGNVHCLVNNITDQRQYKSFGTVSLSIQIIRQEIFFLS